VLAHKIPATEFETLYRRFAPYVNAILVSKVPHLAVEDLIQEVFAEAWRKLDQLQELSSFGPWVAAIARNKAADYHRRRMRTVSLESISEPGSSLHPEPAEPLLEALRQLPEAYHETLALRFVEGFTGPEIAEITGLTHGSVRVNLSRGVQMLREIYGVVDGK
jgi:RNA polymerase sigma-70 factor (ECF subfamily)